MNPSQGSDDTDDRPGEPHAVESESRAQGNSSGCPRLSRLTQNRARWHQAGPTSTKTVAQIAATARQRRQRRNNIFIRPGWAPPGAHGSLKGKLGFSLQAARKTLEGKQHPDRDAQFGHINDTVARAIAAGQPAISIDTKKKELVGEFKNSGREWHPKGQGPRVNTYDFPSMADGKAIPYGVYDIADNSAMVSVGIDRDTAEFSVAAIRAWWEQLGSPRYPAAKTLTITADCGGSNGNRTRLWKTELQKLANDTGLQITVLHFRRCSRGVGA